MNRVPAAVFALLICATVGAFLVAQRLKHSPPAIGHANVTKFFSPNGDGVRDTDTVSFRTKKSDDATITIVDHRGDRVRELVSGVAAKPYQPVKATWDGRTDSGKRAPDGIYRMRVALQRQGRTVIIPGVIHLDTKPPVPKLCVQKVGDNPGSIGAPGAEVRAIVKAVGGRAKPGVQVWRTDVKPAVHVRTIFGKARHRRVLWDGKVSGGKPAPVGTYLLVPVSVDRAKNQGSNPQQLPPTIDAPPKTSKNCNPGVTFRHLAAQMPVTAVTAGSSVSINIDSRKQPYTWRVRHLAAPRSRAHGSGKPGQPLTFTAPNGRSGMFIFDIRSGGEKIKVPLLVQAKKPSPLLIVLPAATWLGSEPLDDDADGLPNELSFRTPVRLPRVQTSLPSDFGPTIGPMLTWLDRVKIPYDLTTDLALTNTPDPRQDNRTGVLLLGDFTWEPADIARRLRRYVEAGGRVGLIGSGLTQTVTATASSLTRPTQPTKTDLFGSRVRGLTTYKPSGQYPNPPEIVSTKDTVGLFEGTGGSIAGAKQLLPIASVGSRSQVLSEASQEVRDGELSPGVPADPNNPAAGATAAPDQVILAARFGKGLVVRAGIPELPSTLCQQPTRAQLMRNFMDLLRNVKPRQRDAAQGCRRHG